MVAVITRINIRLSFKLIFRLDKYKYREMIQINSVANDICMRMSICVCDFKRYRFVFIIIFSLFLKSKSPYRIPMM